VSLSFFSPRLLLLGFFKINKKKKKRLFLFFMDLFFSLFDEKEREEKGMRAFHFKNKKQEKKNYI